MAIGGSPTANRPPVTAYEHACCGSVRWSAARRCDRCGAFPTLVLFGVPLWDLMRRRHSGDPPPPVRTTPAAAPSPLTARPHGPEDEGLPVWAGSPRPDKGPQPEILTRALGAGLAVAAGFLLVALSVVGYSDSAAPSLIALAAAVIAFYVPLALARPSKQPR